jgi:HSP20 family protein
MGSAPRAERRQIQESQRRQTMALSKWEPFESLTALQREMNRMFERFFDDGSTRLGERALEPAIEVADTPDAVVVKAQVPGVPKDQLHLTITEDAMTLKGEIREEEKKEGKNYYRRELRYGTFERTIPLPVAVQAEKATADLKDGILAVTLPKRETAKAKQIPIQAS